MGIREEETGNVVRTAPYPAGSYYIWNGCIVKADSWFQAREKICIKLSTVCKVSISLVKPELIIMNKGVSNDRNLSRTILRLGP